MELNAISNEELIERLDQLSGKDRHLTLTLMQHLNELDRRALYRELGYSSLFDYCVRKLKYSEASAYRRISGARAMREHPELAELFISGQVTLCTIAEAARGLKEKKTTVEEIVGKSKREVQALVAQTEPKPKPREVIKPLAVELPELPLFELKAGPAEERYSLKFSVKKDVYLKFQETKEKMSNCLGRDLSLEAVFERLLESYLRPKTRRAKGAGASRYIPRSMRRAVYARDGGQCTFMAPDGTRCVERRYLQFDHVWPYALGGKTNLENLRLRCAAHNKLCAEKTFGGKYTKRAPSEAH